MTEPTYTIDEAAKALGYAPTTLRDYVTEGRVPHHRRFGTKGVYFTGEDLEQIQQAFAVSAGVRFPKRVDATPTQTTFDPSTFAGLRTARQRRP